MKQILLTKNDFTSLPAGANIAFHLIRWNNELNTFTLKTGGNLHFHSRSTDTMPHHHQFPEICIILKGRIIHHANGEEQDLSGGSIVFIRPSDSHYFKQYKNETCELVNFAFKLEHLLDLSKYLEYDYFLRDFTAPPLPPSFKTTTGATEALALKLLEINTLQITSPSMAKAKTKSILAELFTKFFMDENSPEKSGSLPEWLENASSKMRKDSNITLGIKQLYKLAGRTPEHVCASFRKYLNKTPTEFINELRAEKAAKLLIDTDEKIVSIANETGFKSASRFHLVFKKHYSLSPARFRALHRHSNIP